MKAQWKAVLFFFLGVFHPFGDLGAISSLGSFYSDYKLFSQRAV